MSISVMSVVWVVPMNPVDKLVLLKIADCAHHDGTGAFPRVAEVAMHTGLSERTVQRALKTLRAQGWLTVTSDANRYSPTVYAINLSKASDRGDNHTSKGRQTVTPGVTLGRAGATVSRNRGDSGDVEAPPPYNPPTLQPSEEPSKQPSTTTNTPATDRGTTPGFTLFWKVYPRKIGRQAAWAVWKKLHLEPKATVIADAAFRQRSWASWQRDDGRYIPHPATWLNHGRWEDEPDGPPSESHVVETVDASGRVVRYGGPGYLDVR